MFGIIVGVFDPYTYNLMKNTFSRGTKLLVILGRHGDPNCSMFCVVFSYVLTGTEKGMNQTFGTTCHGAVSSYIICNIFSWFESMMTKKMQNDHSISWFQTLGWIRFETCRQICLFVMIFSFPFSQKVFWNVYLYIYYLSIHFSSGKSIIKIKVTVCVSSTKNKVISWSILT